MATFLEKEIANNVEKQLGPNCFWAWCLDVNREQKMKVSLS